MGEISIITPNSHRLYNISNQRLERLLDNNKKNATYMTIWDRIKDFFCTEKKSEALEELYHFIHDNNHSPSQGADTENINLITSKIKAFHKLQSLANNKDKELFSISRNNRCGIDFYIGSNFIKSIDYCELGYTRYQLNTHPDTKNIISSPEAEQYLYDLIDGIDIPSLDNNSLTTADPIPKTVAAFNKLNSLAYDIIDGINTKPLDNNWLIIADPIPKMVATFNKLKSLANDDQKKLFYIDKNERDGIDFYIGSVLIKSLAHCQSSYALNQLNTCPNIKKHINNMIKNALMTKNRQALNNFVTDMIRKDQDSAIDGKKLVNTTNEGQEKTIELLESFYNSLTPPQQKAICEVGWKKSAFAHIINTLESNPNDFWNNYIHMGLANSTVMYHNDNSSDITVIQTFRRQPSELYYQGREILKEVEKKQDKYPTLQMDAAFTISSNGDVNCSLLHVSDTLKPPVFSLDELKRTISNEIS